MSSCASTLNKTSNEELDAAIEAVKLKRMLAALDAVKGNGTSVITLLLKP